MACNGCTKTFGLFSREYGCPSCKYSFCSKCLKFRIKIDGKNKDVCLRCYEFSKSGTDPNSKKCTKKLTSETPILDEESPPTTVNIIRPTALKEHKVPPTDDDSLIRERLAALKQKDDENPQEPETSTSAGTTLTDIEKRLAVLKGVEYKDYAEANKRFLQQRDNRSEEDQIRDLMAQFAQEQDIHESMSNYRLAAVDDIEKRLAALKDVPEGVSTKENPKTEGNEPLPDSEEENEDEAAKKLTAKFMEEAAIDCKKTSEDDEMNMNIPTPLNPLEMEELPWCTICNENATIRCISCGGDLFCRPCFKECHDDDEDYREHETKPYKAIRREES